MTQSAIPSSGLSAGTTAGIGVGVGLGVALLIAAGILIGWKIRKDRSRPVSSEGYSAVGIENGRGIRVGEMPLGDMLKPNPIKSPPHGQYNVLSELENPPPELGEGRPIELQ